MPRAISYSHKRFNDEEIKISLTKRIINVQHTTYMKANISSKAPHLAFGNTSCRLGQKSRGGVWAFLLAITLMLAGFIAKTLSATELPPFAKFIVEASPQPLPELEFVDTKGAPIHLASYRGKVLLINFWATWCVPCVKEMPTLDSLQAQRGGDKFAVITISLDRNGEKLVPKFFADKALKFLPQILDPQSRSMKPFALKGLPTSLLVDAQGLVLGRLAGEADWASEAALSLIDAAIAGARS
jgi:thiol-disulfide isomerase/thioredoxin